MLIEFSTQKASHFFIKVIKGDGRTWNKVLDDQSDTSDVNQTETEHFVQGINQPNMFGTWEKRTQDDPSECCN